MEQKVIITSIQSTINAYLEKGWVIVFQPVSQIVSGSNYHSMGDFCFVLEREKQA